MTCCVLSWSLISKYVNAILSVLCQSPWCYLHLSVSFSFRSDSFGLFFVFEHVSRTLLSFSIFAMIAPFPSTEVLCPRYLHWWVFIFTSLQRSFLSCQPNYTISIMLATFIFIMAFITWYNYACLLVCWFNIYLCSQLECLVH